MQGGGGMRGVGVAGGWRGLRAEKDVVGRTRELRALLPGFTRLQRRCGPRRGGGANGATAAGVRRQWVGEPLHLPLLLLQVELLVLHLLQLLGGLHLSLLLVLLAHLLQGGQREQGQE